MQIAIKSGIHMLGINPPLSGGWAVRDVWLQHVGFYMNN